MQHFPRMKALPLLSQATTTLAQGNEIWSFPPILAPPGEARNGREGWRKEEEEEARTVCKWFPRRRRSLMM